MEPGEKREFGKAMVHRVEGGDAAGSEALLGGLEEEFQVCVRACCRGWQERAGRGRRRGGECWGGLRRPPPPPSLLPHTHQMWMSHGDKVTRLPEGFSCIAATNSGCENAAIANLSRNMFGLQFHPEVTHSPRGKDILKNFVVGICSAPQVTRGLSGDPPERKGASHRASHRASLEKEHA